MYKDIVQALQIASDQTAKTYSSKDYKVLPGWNDYVKEAHSLARNTYVLWRNFWKPRFGPIFEHMVKN